MESFGLLKLLSALADTDTGDQERPPLRGQEPVREQEPFRGQERTASPGQTGKDEGLFTAEERARRAAEMLERHRQAVQRIGKNPRP